MRNYLTRQAMKALKASVVISGGPNELGRIGVSIRDIGAGMTAHAAIVEANRDHSTVPSASRSSRKWNYKPRTRLPIQFTVLVQK